jgi:hypothetical protein
LRVAKQAEWNKATWWPIGLLGLGVLALVAVGWRSHSARQRATAKAHPGPVRSSPAPAAGG